MDTGRQSAVLDFAVVELAGERVIDIKRNAYALTPGYLRWNSAAQSPPYPAADGFAFGERWIPAHQWPP
jgi:hypothetical protein